MDLSKEKRSMSKNLCYTEKVYKHSSSVSFFFLHHSAQKNLEILITHYALFVTQVVGGKERDFTQSYELSWIWDVILKDLTNCHNVFLASKLSVVHAKHYQTHPTAG